MSNKIRLGILGGGGDSLIGILHRVASSMFDRYEIIGGVFNPNYKDNLEFAKNLVTKQEEQPQTENSQIVDPNPLANKLKQQQKRLIGSIVQNYIKSGKLLTILEKNLNKILDHCTKFDAKLLCAKVGLANSDDYELPLFKNSSYIINYEGIEKIN